MTRDEFNKMRGVVPSLSKESTNVAKMPNAKTESAPHEPSTESLHDEGELTGNKERKGNG